MGPRDRIGQVNHRVPSPQPAKKKRANKFTDEGAPEQSMVPASLQRAAVGFTNTPQIDVPTVKVSSEWFKAIQIPACYVPDLIGPHGSRINAFRRECGADIKVDHQRGKSHANIIITGANAAAAEALIYAHLAASQQPHLTAAQQP